MLNLIPSILPSAAVKAMMDMGHGDTLVIADANYPAHTNGKLVVDCPCVSGAAMLEAILKLMPLDTYVPSPVELMDVVPGDPIGTPPIWAVYKEIIRKHSPETAPAMIERHAFYEKSRGAFVIIQTGETALYANIILSKGVVK